MYSYSSINIRKKDDLSGGDLRLFKWSSESMASVFTSEQAGYRSFSKNSAIHFR